MSIDTLTFEPGTVRTPMESGRRDRLLKELPDWTVETANQELLTAEFGFDDFADALQFANQVGDLAEAHDHHPELTVEYGRVRVRWWTHTAGGIASNDLVLARETSRLYAQQD